MIAAAIRPFLNAEVHHWLPPARDIHGHDIKAGYTAHPARVTYTAGAIIGPASMEHAANAAATIWLVNHPRPIGVGDTFELATGEILKVIRSERRTAGTDNICKVYLS